MNVHFDKAAFEKARSIKNDVSNEVNDSKADYEGKIVEDTIRNSLKTEKLGALSVDPMFLRFKILQSKCEIPTFQCHFNLYSLHSR